MIIRFTNSMSIFESCEYDIRLYKTRVYGSLEMITDIIIHISIHLIIVVRSQNELSIEATGN